MEKVLLVGVGEVGTHLLEFVARDEREFEWIVCDVDENRARWACNNAEIGAHFHGKYPQFRPMQLDLFDIEKTTNLIQKEKPVAVINCTVLHTWHLISQLPYELYAKISEATLGAWLPCQLALAMNLAQAIKNSELNPYYINTSLSCLTNPVLGKLGLAPTIGIGNVDLIAPAIVTYISQQRNISPKRIETFQVCHHQHWVYPREAGYKDGAPFFLKILIDGVDVTDEFDTKKVMYDAVKLYAPKTEFSSVSASSTIKNLKALVFDQGIRTHSPGPLGLSGGYPIVLDKSGATIALPPEITLDEAIAMNEKSNQFDGIEAIQDDGTVVFADYTYELMREYLGFTCKSFKPSESKELAFEQMAKFRELLDKSK